MALCINGDAEARGLSNKKRKYSWDRDNQVCKLSSFDGIFSRKQHSTNSLLSTGRFSVYTGIPQSGPVKSVASGVCGKDGAQLDLEEGEIVDSQEEEGEIASPETLVPLWLSPKRALRAAMLKQRFADIILKAKQKSLFDQVEPMKLQMGKKKLERQQEEKARIEGQIRASKVVASSLKAQEEPSLWRKRERELRLRRERERQAAVASSLKAQEELRLRREREREAARIALQKMEKTVEIEDNMKVLKELEMILYKARQGDRFGNIMERIGLSLKNDYMDYEEEEDVLFLQDWEEGQVCN